MGGFSGASPSAMLFVCLAFWSLLEAAGVGIFSCRRRIIGRSKLRREVITQPQATYTSSRGISHPRILPLADGGGANVNVFTLSTVGNSLLCSHDSLCSTMDR